MEIDSTRLSELNKIVNGLSALESKCQNVSLFMDRVTICDENSYKVAEISYSNEEEWIITFVDSPTS